MLEGKTPVFSSNAVSTSKCPAARKFLKIIVNVSK